MFSRKPALLVVAFTFIASFIAFPLVSAQTNNQATGGSALQISPTRTELSGQPGDKKTFSITLKNVASNDVTAQVFLNDFESDGESGTPQIITDTNRERTPYSLSKMLQGQTDVDLKPNETKEIKLNIDIPANTAPGAYFGALRYAAVPKGQSLSDAQRQVALTASVAHLVFVEVPGDINQQIQIQKVTAQVDNKAGSFFFKAPNKSAVSIKNLGNGFSRPFGQVVLNGPFGKQKHSYELNNTNPRGIVLPNSTRTFTDDLKNVKVPGKYSITASAAYGNGGEVVSYKASFWYLPIWFLILVVLLVAGAAFGSYTFYRRRIVKSSAKKR